VWLGVDGSGCGDCVVVLFMSLDSLGDGGHFGTGFILITVPYRLQWRVVRMV
jgi:hypothetical protein